MTTTQSPPAASGPLYSAIRPCAACAIRDEKNNGAVPGVGPARARVAFIGEAPGRNEDKDGIPFVGQAGGILDDLLDSIGLHREDCYITNTTKCRPRGNRTPTTDEVTFCAGRWLVTEMHVVQPQIVVTLGVPATAWALGVHAGEIRMEDFHAAPLENVALPGGYVAPLVFPCYHPALAIHNTPMISELLSGFRTLKRVLDGERAADLVPRDEYAGRERYEQLERPLDIERVIRGAKVVAFDTETLGLHGELWSVQVSNEPGTGYFIAADAWRRFVHEYCYNGQPLLGQRDDGAWNGDDTLAVFHNYRYDAPYLPPVRRFADTMHMAYSLGLPQGLKRLARDLCGMEMRDLDEFLAPKTQEMAFEWMANAAIRHKFPPSEPLEYEDWSVKDGARIVKIRTPKQINLKMLGILSDVLHNGADIVARWESVDPRERAQVEELCGPLPEASIADVDVADAFRYSARDPDAGIRVYYELRPRIERAGLAPVLDDIDTPTLDSFVEMRRNGMPASAEMLRALEGDLTTAMHAQAEEAAGLLGQLWDATISNDGARPDSMATRLWPGWTHGAGRLPFNPNSSVQRAHVFYTLLQFKPPKERDDEGGTKAPSTARKALKALQLETRASREELMQYTAIDSVRFAELEDIDRLIEVVCDYVQHAKVRNAYARTLPKFIDVDDGRIHADILTTRTETGRPATRDPNVLAIPTRSAIGRRVREAFVASDGRVILGVDEGQMEFRVLAHLSQDERLIRLFREGVDVHSANVSEIYGIPYEDVDPDGEERYVIKRVGFGVAYKLSKYGLLDLLVSEELEGWDLQRCAGIIDDFYRLCAGVKRWQDDIVAGAARDGYVKSLYGRIRWIPELQVSDAKIRGEGERNAVNMPVQATAQDILKLAQAKIWRDYPHERGDALWLLQQYDELIWEVVEERAEWFAAEFAAIMANVVKLDVPLQTTAKVGKSWADLKKVLEVTSA